MFTSLTRPAVTLASVVGLVVTLAACSGGSTSSDPTPSPTGPADPVTLVTYDSYAISKSTLRAFTEETGYPVQIVRAGDAAEVVNRALLTNGTPEGDVLFGVDDNLLSRATEAQLFEPYDGAGVEKVPQEYRVESGVTPIDLGDVCVNFDRRWFADQGLAVPRTLDDLTLPEYRDLLVVENPATSTPGLAFLLASVAQFGPEGFSGYWQRLKGNGVQVENSWDSAYYRRFSGGSGEGDRPLVVSYASSPPAEVAFADDPTGPVPTGVLLDTCYRQIEFAGLLTGAPNPDGGKALIDFMLTSTYQEDLPLSNFVFPVIPGTKLPKVFQDHAELAAEPLSLPPEEVAVGRDTWVARWTDIMQR